MYGLIRLWVCTSCGRRWTSNFRKVKMDCPECGSPGEGTLIPKEMMKTVKKSEELPNSKG